MSRVLLRANPPLNSSYSYREDAHVHALTRSSSFLLYPMAWFSCLSVSQVCMTRWPPGWSVLGEGLVYCLPREAAVHSAFVAADLHLVVWLPRAVVTTVPSHADISLAFSNISNTLQSLLEWPLVPVFHLLISLLIVDSFLPLTLIETQLLLLGPSATTLVPLQVLLPSIRFRFIRTSQTTPYPIASQNAR